MNPVDNAIRAGYLRDFLSPTFPFVFGFDVAGVVDIVGADVTAFGAGDAVVGHLLGEGLRCGAYGELVTAHPDWFVSKPDALTFREAAAVPHAALTASQALSELNVATGDTVLIHAAAGGVGSFAVQLARMAGARVIGTASPANHDYLRRLGAEPVSYEHNLVAQVRQLAPSGVDVIMDLIGGTNSNRASPCSRQAAGSRRPLITAWPGSAVIWSRVTRTPVGSLNLSPWSRLATSKLTSRRCIHCPTSQQRWSWSARGMSRAKS